MLLDRVTLEDIEVNLKAEDWRSYPNVSETFTRTRRYQRELY